MLEAWMLALCLSYGGIYDYDSQQCMTEKYVPGGKVETVTFYGVQMDVRFAELQKTVMP